VHYESLPAIHATLERFEGELFNTVPHEYKELLRVNLDAGYKLGVRTLLRTATAVFDCEDPSDREAVFYLRLSQLCLQRRKRYPRVLIRYRMHFR
jgi:hypothetical protein